ncbi:MFS transporter, partial [Bacillus vallismortis]|nr:MFS transporter [Bacillus vallismortis]
PIFVQAENGSTASSSCNIRTQMMLGSVIFSKIGGKIQTKARFRPKSLITLTAFIITMHLLSNITPHTAREWQTVYFMVTGRVD